MRERNIVPVIRVTINLYLEAQKKIYEHHHLKTLFIKLQIRILKAFCYIGLPEHSYETN